MTRVKIKFPDEKPLCSVTIPVRITDVNYGSHLGNDSMLSIIHEARMQMLGNWGYTEIQAGGCGMIMADAMIAYKGEGHYGDLLKIDMYVTEFTGSSFDILYHIATQREGQEKLIAHAKTGMAFFDYEKRKMMRATPEIKNKLLGIEN